MSADPTHLPKISTWEPSKVRAAPQKPPAKPLSSLVASATRLTSKQLSTRLGQSFGDKKSWQDDAWEMLDLVGEQRFLATTLAGRLSQARFYVGKIGQDSTEHPEPVDDENISGILDTIGDSPAGRAQLINRLAVSLFVAGDGWLVGIPSQMIKDAKEGKQGSRGSSSVRTPFGGPQQTDIPKELHLEDLEWRMLSVSEIVRHEQDKVKILLGDSEEEQITADPDDLYIIRVWRPHPRKSWEADSPTRASLPILRELVGLTMHISAQVDSRLAGAGLLVIPQGAQRALRAAAGADDDDQSDHFTEALMQAMVTPIEDRSSASAVVPLVVTVPDELTDKFNHISFSTPLDAEARNLRDEAIRRLALGQDAPPELLLGTAGMNHWGAWLVREDVVSTHLEPPLSLICDALTTQFLWPILRDQGMSDEEAQKHVIWFDVSQMIVSPNRTDDAKGLHADGVISDEALRRETGFDDTDAPKDFAKEGKPEVRMALDLVAQNPGLLASPGLPSVVAQFQRVLSGEELDMAPLGEQDDAESDTEPGEVPEVDVPSREQPAGSPGGRSGPARAERTQVPTRTSDAPRIGEAD